MPDLNQQTKFQTRTISLLTSVLSEIFLTLYTQSLQSTLQPYLGVLVLCNDNDDNDVVTIILNITKKM